METAWEELTVSGCYACRLRPVADSRGTFQKFFNDKAFDDVLPGFVPRESYLTTSAKGVLRGMHFQLPPNDHAKLVICLQGSALDVMVDLRRGPGFGGTTQVELSPNGTNCVVMPIGIGHGFYSRCDGTQLLYFVGSGYAEVSDSGVLWSSICLDWPDLNPILSPRDERHPALSEFTSPGSWSSN